MNQQMEHTSAYQQSEEVEIDLLDLIGFYMSKLPVLIAAILIGALVSGVFTHFFIPDEFTAVSRMYMVSASSEAVVNLSDLNVGTSLSNDYVELMKSRPIVEGVINSLGLDYKYEQVLGMIDLSVVNNTRIVKISVTSNDPNEAMSIANEMAVMSKEKLPLIMDAPSPHIAEEAVLPKYRSSPSLSRNVILGAMLFLIAVLAVYTVIYLLDDTIKTSEDVEKTFGVMPLAIIPEGEKSGESKSSQKKDRRRLRLLRFGRKRKRSKYVDSRKYYYRTSGKSRGAGAGSGSSGRASSEAKASAASAALSASAASAQAAARAPAASGGTAVPVPEVPAQAAAPAASAASGGTAVHEASAAVSSAAADSPAASTGLPVRTSTAVNSEIPEPPSSESDAHTGRPAADTRPVRTTRPARPARPIVPVRPLRKVISGRPIKTLTPVRRQGSLAPTVIPDTETPKTVRESAQQSGAPKETTSAVALEPAVSLEKEVGITSGITAPEAVSEKAVAAAPLNEASVGTAVTNGVPEAVSGTTAYGTAEAVSGTTVYGTAEAVSGTTAYETAEENKVDRVNEVLPDAVPAQKAAEAAYSPTAAEAVSRAERSERTAGAIVPETVPEARTVQTTETVSVKTAGAAPDQTAAGIEIENPQAVNENGHRENQRRVRQRKVKADHGLSSDKILNKETAKKTVQTGVKVFKLASDTVLKAVENRREHSAGKKKSTAGRVHKTNTSSRRSAEHRAKTTDTAGHSAKKTSEHNTTGE